jgi:hypothetical protein
MRVLPAHVYRKVTCVGFIRMCLSVALASVKIETLVACDA